ncbi:hypothetical protein [Erythrobacter sp. THAF29]|uniref:hypothetical protein n=1 Tax=Erythrobacter sp. THAF29 TaxID=2587851 RepID=UPI0012682763|nr:hypothetical protein [Erythrobacter sp. THAF29]QFT76055.1 hypothetical protein FIU90_00735 [Erythrobacter sp. THAF29]
MTERQYIIGRRADGDHKALEECLKHALENEEIKVVSGNPNKILILMMNEEMAEDMRKKFQKDLSIEEDAPLRY